jgi:hypothetical protein
MPPSGQQILRLFLVPALIVGVLVAMFLAGGTLKDWFDRLLGRSVGDARSVEQFLRDLDNENPDVRYRAASDLSNVLPRKEELTYNAAFGLALADRLDKKVRASAAAEKEFARRRASLNAADEKREEKKLEDDRSFITFLSGSLGHFRVPVGATLLRDLAAQESGVEPEALTRRRLQALFALTVLGANLERYDRLPAERKEEIDKDLRDAAADSQNRARATETLDYLRHRRAGKPDTMGIAAVLVQCADNDDPSLRFHAAFAMTYWRGTPKEDAGLDTALVKLAHDDGRGEEELEERLDRNSERKVTRPRFKKKGYHVQPQAVLALARRGSPNTPLDALQELLDEKRLGEIIVIHNRQSGQEEPDTALIYETISNALRALVRLHRKRPEDVRLVKRFRPVVERLTHHESDALKAEARETLLALGAAE